MPNHHSNAGNRLLRVPSFVATRLAVRERRFGVLVDVVRLPEATTNRENTATGRLCEQISLACCGAAKCGIQRHPGRVIRE